MLEPNQVFRPGQLPLAPTNVYAKRGEAEEDFQKALRRGMVPLVYGEYGVGKTSMARRGVLDADAQGRLVNIESVAGQSVSDVLKRCLEKIGYTVTTEISTQQADTLSSKKSGEVSIPFKAFTAKFGGEVSKTKGETISQKEQFAVSSPTDSKVIDLCEQGRLVLLIDELHKASPGFIEELALLIKTYANKNCKNFRIILLGTSSDASRLVFRDPGIDRLLQEISLKALSESESRFVVEEGMSHLNIQTDAAITDRIVKTASGSPTLVQYLCLEIAEAAFERNPRIATMTDFKAALDSYVKKKAALLHILWGGEQPDRPLRARRSRGWGRTGGLRDPGVPPPRVDSRQAPWQSSGRRFSQGLRHRLTVRP